MRRLPSRGSSLCEDLAISASSTIETWVSDALLQANLMALLHRSPRAESQWSALEPIPNPERLVAVDETDAPCAIITQLVGGPPANPVLPFSSDRVDAYRVRVPIITGRDAALGSVRRVATALVMATVAHRTSSVIR